MSREIPCPPRDQRSTGVRGPRSGRMTATRPAALAAKTKHVVCCSPSSARPVFGNRTTSDPSMQRQQQRNMERLNKKIGTMNLTSPIRKQGGHLRAHTSFGTAQDKTHTPQRIMPFQRKPAHIKAMEDCRKLALRPSLANANVSKQLSELMSKSRRYCGELCKQLSALAALTDFKMLDRIVAHRGEDALLSLRSACDEVNQLASSFTQLLVVPGTAAPNRTSSAEGCKSNCIQIKSVVVSLRAIADKLADQPCDVDSASKIVRLVEQGLVEQLLSWVGECESAYEVLVPEKRHAPKGSATLRDVPSNIQSARTCNGASTTRLGFASRKQFIVQPRRDSSGGRREREPSPPTDIATTCSATQRLRHQSPPVESVSSLSATTPFTYSSAPRVCKTIAERRERLQRHRPSMLIIPSAV